MKKIILVAAVAGLFVASCRKDRTCTCVTTSNESGFVSSTRVTTQKSVKGSNAGAWCQSYTQQLTAPVTSTVIEGEDCTLK